MSSLPTHLFSSIFISPCTSSFSTTWSGDKTFLSLSQRINRPSMFLQIRLGRMTQSHEVGYSRARLSI